MKKQFKAWAIETNDATVLNKKIVRSTFLGRYYFHQSKIQPSNEGCTIALFDTRKEARKALRKMKNGHYVAHPNAAVRRVRVTIETV